MIGEPDKVPLIRTRLQCPRLAGNLIPRCWRLDLLHAGMDRKLALNSAQTGTGKTTLLARLLAECPSPAPGCHWPSTTKTWLSSWPTYVARFGPYSPVPARIHSIRQMQPSPHRCGLSPLLKRV